MRKTRVSGGCLAEILVPLGKFRLPSENSGKSEGAKSNFRALNKQSGAGGTLSEKSGATGKNRVLAGHFNMLCGLESSRIFMILEKRGKGGMVELR